MVNERPIERHPQSPEEGTYLCPNDLLLGRATARAPHGPFLKTTNPNHRHEFVQKSVDSFWKKWTRDYFPSLIVRQKWHTERQNLQEGDIVLFQDSNLVRDNWKLGRVSQIFPSQDGKVRKVEVRYKNPQPGEPTNEYRDRILCGIRSQALRKRLLCEADQFLQKAMDTCKATEHSRVQVKTFNNSGKSSVDKIGKKHNRPIRSHEQRKDEHTPRNTSKPQRTEQHTQRNCGRNHQPKQCPAYGKQCNNCNKLKHFGKYCRSVQNYATDSRKPVRGRIRQ